MSVVQLTFVYDEIVSYCIVISIVYKLDAAAKHHAKFTRAQPQSVYQLQEILPSLVRSVSAVFANPLAILEEEIP